MKSACFSLQHNYRSPGNDEKHTTDREEEEEAGGDEAGLFLHVCSDCLTCPH